MVRSKQRKWFVQNNTNGSFKNPKVPTSLPYYFSRKRNRRAPKKRTKINVLFLKVGPFVLQKKREKPVVMQMQRIPKK
jgi:hypothetical protein